MTQSASARGVLKLIASQPDHHWRRSRKELAEQLGLTPDRLAEIIAYLEEEGLVRRQAGSRYHLSLVGDDEVLGDYEERYLACRDRRHSWDKIGFYIGAFGGIQRWNLCSRCGTERDDHEIGGVIHRTYHYPEGYQLLGHKVTAYQVRQEVVRRSPVHKSREACRGAAL